MALIAALTMSATLMAQSDNNQRGERHRFDKNEMVKRRTEMLVKTYGLNDEQAKQLMELNIQYADKMGPGRGPRFNGQRGPRGQRAEMEKKDFSRGDTLKNAPRPQRDMRPNMEKMQQEREAYNKELQKILTEEQYKAYIADEEKRMKEGPRGGRDRGPRQSNNQ